MEVRTEVTISAAHHLPNYNGCCKNLHGHSWKIEISARGDVDKRTGMVVDFSELKALVNKLDHTNINDTIRNPTAENIAVVIWNRLRSKLEAKYELSIRLYETERNFVEYNGQ
jgi:6-pyruvoyltetrahydropterin/6-carboxytetrahydropterin synthase